MAKTVKIAKSSWQLGWIDGIERKVGRNATLPGVDSEAYWRGVNRASEFRRRISAVRSDRIHQRASHAIDQ